CVFFFFFQAEDGIRDATVTGVQTCALPILERLDRASGELAVVDLPQRETRDRRGPSVTETRQLGQRAAVVGESLELDELDAVDGRRGPVGLEVKGALGVGREFHRPDLDLTAPPRPGATGTARRSCPSSASRSTRRRPP